MCWHKWSKWKKIVVPFIFIQSKETFDREMQERTCSKCGKVERQEIQGF